MEESIYIIGAGTYGEAMYELAEQVGYKVEGFYDEDDNKINSYVMDKDVIGKFSELNEEEIKSRNFIVAIGNNTIRYELMTKINQQGGKTPTLIHPRASISPSAIIGNGVYIQANSTIWTKVKIDDYSIIRPNVVIAHHSLVGKACLISTLSGVGASIKIGDRVFAGMGSTIVTGVKSVGAETIIGAGAVVLKDLPANCTAVGTPAKVIKIHK